MSDLTSRSQHTTLHFYTTTTTALTLRHAHASGQIFYEFNCDLNMFLIWLGVWVSRCQVHILLSIVLWKITSKKKKQQTKFVRIFSSIHCIRSACIWPATHIFCKKKFSHHVSWYWLDLPNIENRLSNIHIIKQFNTRLVMESYITKCKFDWYNVFPSLNLIFLVFLFHFSFQ